MSQIFALDEQQFAADFNRRPFVVRHELADHPCFSSIVWSS